MRLLNRIFRGRDKGDDESFKKQKDDFLRYSTFSDDVNTEGCDQIPGAYGSFGITPTNPIPVNGVIGECVYLFRLRSKTGVGFYYHRLGSLSSPPSKNPIDHYELVAADASEWCYLFFDCYYPRRSIKTPEGLTLSSWNSLDDELKKLAKLPSGGVNIKVDNFPNGLPDAIESCERLNSVFPDLGFEIAKKIRRKMREYEGKWERNKIHLQKQPLNKVTGSHIIQCHLAEYLAVLWQFFTDFENVRTTFNFANKPRNLNGLIDFALFLDMITNLPNILAEHSTTDMKDVIYRFVKNSVNVIPRLSDDFGETRIRQAAARVMFYSQLLVEDLQRSETPNYQSVHELLKEVFFGKIADNEKIVLTNMLTAKSSPIMELIFMKSNDIENIKSDDMAKENSMTADDYFNRGDNLLFSDKPDRNEVNEAIKDFTMCIALDPKHKIAYLARGIALYDIDEFRNALSDFKKLVEINPNSALSILWIGNCYMRLKKYGFASKCFTKYLEIEPNHEPTLKYLESINKIFEQYKGIMTSFSIMIGKGQESRNPVIIKSYISRAMLHKQLGNYFAARQDLLQVLRIDPENVDVNRKLQDLIGYEKEREEINTIITVWERDNGKEIGTKYSEVDECNDDWLKHFEEAYKFPFRNDLRLDVWQEREYSPKERKFLLSKYTEDLKKLHQQDVEDIVLIMTRYLFQKAAQGYTFCALEKIESTFGKTLEQNYGVSNGCFYDFAKTYWTFKVLLDEESFEYMQEKSTPLYFMILRDVEVNIASGFFPTGGYVSKENQIQILKEFAPEINIEKFISENPML